MGPELGGDPGRRILQAIARTSNFEGVQKEIYGQFENTFMMYLPRLCEHCLNPACVASCPSGAIYKREEDGIVLIDQDKCRGWRMCVSGCPTRRSITTGDAARPRSASSAIRASRRASRRCARKPASAASAISACVLYDADRIAEAASGRDEHDLYQAQLDVFSIRTIPKVMAQARRRHRRALAGGGQQSPVYKMAMDWKVAFPLHPEYRTLPMVWYVPPLSPIQSRGRRGQIGTWTATCPTSARCAFPCRYLANLLTAGDEGRSCRRWNACWRCAPTCARKTVDGVDQRGAADGSASRPRRSRRCTGIMAIANYEDRFVIPTSASRNWRGRLRPERLLRLHLRQGLLRTDRVPPVRPEAATRQDAMQVA